MRKWQMYKAAELLSKQCDQIGRFFMFFATNFLIKAAQIFSYCWVYFKKRCFYEITDVSTFWVTFGLPYILTSGYTVSKQKQALKWICASTISVETAQKDFACDLNGWSQPVWPDDQIVFSIFSHFQQWTFAQKHTQGHCWLKPIMKLGYFLLWFNDGISKRPACGCHRWCPWRLVVD